MENSHPTAAVFFANCASEGEFCEGSDAKREEPLGGEQQLVPPNTVVADSETDGDSGGIWSLVGAPSAASANGGGCGWAWSCNGESDVVEAMKEAKGDSLDPWDCDEVWYSDEEDGAGELRLSLYRQMSSEELLKVKQQCQIASYDYQYEQDLEEAQQPLWTNGGEIVSGDEYKGALSSLAGLERKFEQEAFLSCHSSFLRCPQGGQFKSHLYGKRTQLSRFNWCALRHLHGVGYTPFRCSGRGRKEYPSHRRPPHLACSDKRYLFNMWGRHHFPLVECERCDDWSFQHKSDPSQHYLDYTAAVQRLGAVNEGLKDFDELWGEYLRMLHVGMSLVSHKRKLPHPKRTKNKGGNKVAQNKGRSSRSATTIQKYHGNKELAQRKSDSAVKKKSYNHSSSSNQEGARKNKYGGGRGHGGQGHSLLALLRPGDQQEPIINSVAAAGDLVTVDRGKSAVATPIGKPHRKRGKTGGTRPAAKSSSTSLNNFNKEE